YRLGLLALQENIDYLGLFDDHTARRLGPDCRLRQIAARHGPCEGPPEGSSAAGSHRCGACGLAAEYSLRQLQAQLRVYPRVATRCSATLIGEVVSACNCPAAQGHGHR